MLDIYDNYIYVIIYVHFLIGIVIKQKTLIFCESENLMHIQKKALPKIQDGFICASDPESLWWTAELWLETWCWNYSLRYNY